MKILLDVWWTASHVDYSVPSPYLQAKLKLLNLLFRCDASKHNWFLDLPCGKYQAWILQHVGANYCQSFLKRFLNDKPTRPYVQMCWYTILKTACCVIPQDATTMPPFIEWILHTDIQIEKIKLEYLLKHISKSGNVELTIQYIKHFLADVGPKTSSIHTRNVLAQVAHIILQVTGDYDKAQQVMLVDKRHIQAKLSVFNRISLCLQGGHMPSQKMLKNPKYRNISYLLDSIICNNYVSTPEGLNFVLEQFCDNNSDSEERVLQQIRKSREKSIKYGRLDFLPILDVWALKYNYVWYNHKDDVISALRGGRLELAHDFWIKAGCTCSSPQKCWNVYMKSKNVDVTHPLFKQWFVPTIVPYIVLRQDDETWNGNDMIDMIDMIDYACATANNGMYEWLLDFWKHRQCDGYDQYMKERNWYSFMRNIYPDFKMFRKILQEWWHENKTNKNELYHRRQGLKSYISKYNRAIVYNEIVDEIFGTGSDTCPKCKAITKKKVQCSRNVVDNGYCAQHLKQK